MKLCLADSWFLSDRESKFTQKKKCGIIIISLHGRVQKRLGWNGGGHILRQSSLAREPRLSRTHSYLIPKVLT